ncbi:metallophosphoesterase [Candidatus Pacearchaeota archaeon]|nr:metallophosphoesterase [Candidatus Pacearchaeota archaeon]
MRIMQISDLHLSSSNFVPGWAENVVSIVSSIESDIVIGTGDFTDDGYTQEYETAKSYIDRIEAENVMVVPGNHDVKLLPAVCCSKDYWRVEQQFRELSNVGSNPSAGSRGSPASSNAGNSNLTSGTILGGRSELLYTECGSEI